MTTKSKTDALCDCGALEYAARNPRVPIEFDPELNEYNIVHDSLKMRIYYCPSCGGMAPNSLRSTMFAQMSGEEQTRLFALAESLKTEAELVAALGSPDQDSPRGTIVTEPEADGRASRACAFRVFRYIKLSVVADLCVELHPDGRVASRYVEAKYVGPPKGAA
jgi:hypothetical protein